MIAVAGATTLPLRVDIANQVMPSIQARSVRAGIAPSLFGRHGVSAMLSELRLALGRDSENQGRDLSGASRVSICASRAGELHAAAVRNPCADAYVERRWRLDQRDRLCVIKLEQLGRLRSELWWRFHEAHKVCSDASSWGRHSVPAGTDRIVLLSGVISLIVKFSTRAHARR